MPQAAVVHPIGAKTAKIHEHARMWCEFAAQGRADLHPATQSRQYDA